MFNIDGLYIKSVYYLRENRKPLDFSISKPTTVFSHKYDETIVALLLIVVKKPTQQEIRSRKVILLQEILREIPVILQDGTISWLMLEGEGEPSDLVIHTNIREEELTVFATARLVDKAIAKSQRRWGFLHLFRKANGHKAIENAREQSKKFTLFASEPIIHYIN